MGLIVVDHGWPVPAIVCHTFPRASCGWICRVYAEHIWNDRAHSVRLFPIRRDHLVFFNHRFIISGLRLDGFERVGRSLGGKTTKCTVRFERQKRGMIARSYLIISTPREEVLVMSIFLEGCGVYVGLTVFMSDGAALENIS